MGPLGRPVVPAQPHPKRMRPGSRLGDRVVATELPARLDGQPGPGGMQRRTRELLSRVGEVDWSGQGRRLAGLLNPVVASPAAPLETFAALDALGPSLMPRTSRVQGVAVGLSVLGARAHTGAAERLTSLAVPAEAPLRRQLVGR